MSWTKLKSFVTVFFSTIVGFSLFLIVDFFLGASVIGKDLSLDDKPYLKLDRGWYELKPKFTGKDQFGPNIYEVSTDAYGFRKADGVPDHTKHDIVFLGDSFTYGVNGPWKETFVGMFSSGSKVRVLNAGVGSYSPTPYLYQYKKAVKNNLLSAGHKVIIGIDLSDVQDEAGYWRWNQKSENHPHRLETTSSQWQARERLKNAFPLSVAIYRFIRYEALMSQSDPYKVDTINYPRTAITYESWNELNRTYPQEKPTGFLPLGVEGGLLKVSERIFEIVQEVRSNKGAVYFLIYPYPGQIYYEDKFDWSDWVKNLCKKAMCDGVVDTFPVFRNLAIHNKNWLNDYYLQGDVHFNERGNRIVADQLLKEIPVNRHIP